MPGELPHDLDLPSDVLEVVGVQIVLVHDLDGHLGLGQLVYAQPDQGEVALALEVKERREKG